MMTQHGQWDPDLPTVPHSHDRKPSRAHGLLAPISHSAGCTLAVMVIPPPKVPLVPIITCSLNWLKAGCVCVLVGLASLAPTLCPPIR